ncbi:DOME [Acanthosepion pharaonis]|uniref:DOME n=1 Tax=Acanthosepion pharaonis TaxID=158019 RepID=A0A812E6G1_ACAPH|nr:DOME [Sepia pharaonis]
MKTGFACAVFFTVNFLLPSNIGVPEKPKNISCKIFDFIKMVCSWNRLHSSSRSKWSLRYGYRCQRKCIFSRRLNLNQNQDNIVIWNKTSESAFRIYCKKCIQIVGRYKTGTIKSDIITFMPEQIVELSPVNITKIETTDSKIYIKWKHPLIQRPTICYVKYSVSNQPIHNKTKHSKSNDIYLDELSPSTMYIIWIKWKLVNSPYWSKEKCLHVTTNHSALKSGPVITQGSYLRHRCLHTNEACLSIYWKPIQGSLARTKFYEISYCIHLENIYNNTKIVDEKKCSLQMKYPTLPMKSVCIRANTDIGYSPYSAFIFNQDESSPPTVKNVTVKETSDPQMLMVSWSYNPSDKSKVKITNVTIFWCHGKKLFTDVLVVSCEDHIDWITVVANESYQLQLTKVVDVHHFHVAVVLNNRAGSQGMTWSECIFTQTGYISDLNIPLLITTFPEKMLVQWYPVRCKVTIIPLMYQIAYTRQIEKNEENPCKSGSLVNVSISHTSVELKNLKANEFYYICMRIITVVGPTPFTKPNQKKTNVLLTRERIIESKTDSVYITTTQRETETLKNEEGIPQAVKIILCITAGISFVIMVIW